MSRLLPLFFLAAAFLAGCGATPIERSGTEEEIVRDITVELGKDPRFEHVNVTCRDRIVTLKGEVVDEIAEQEAVHTAEGYARGATVLNRLTVRLR